MPPKPDLVYPSLDDFVDVNEFVSESIVKKPTVKSNEPKTARKENEAPIIEDWVSERYNDVPPPYTGNFMPPKPNLVYPSLDDFVDVNEFVSESIVKKPTVKSNEPKTARKENEAPIIKDWDSVKKKTFNGEEQLQVLVDRKKVIITEATIGRDLQLEDAKGVDCLPDTEIFEQLIPMGETPLFLTMTVQAQEDMSEGSAHPTDPHHTPTITQPSTSKPQKKQKPRKPRRQDTEETQPSGPITNVEDEAFNKENVSKHSNDLLHSGKDRIQLKELMKICTNLQNRVFDMENIKTDQARLKRLYKVSLSARVESSDEESLGEEDASKQRRNIADIDADKEITLFDETTEDQGRPKEKRIVMQEAMVDADYQLAERLHAEKQKQLTDAEKAKLFIEFIEKRRKFFAAKRTARKRNKPPTKDQQRSIMNDGDDVTINATPLSVKTPIVDYKIYKEGKKNYF
nr:hypothetical protein [Tanacetum cinerariifolium]